MEVCEDRFFFLGFGREVGQEVNVILWKCMGGGVEIVNFFSIDCERSTVDIYISARGFCVEKTVLFYFLGVLFCTSSKGISFAFFFLVIMRPQAILVWIFSFILIFIFFLLFFL